MTTDERLTDYITGRQVADAGAERNRQSVERFLVEELKYDRTGVGVDVPIAFSVAGEDYRSTLDLVVSIREVPAMVIKCAAGSLGSREREVVAAARLAGTAIAPVAVATDGKHALVFDARSGKLAGEGLTAIPNARALAGLLAAGPDEALSEEHLYRERLIFRSYDSMNVNR